MEKQVGVVLVFREGIDADEAQEAIDALDEMLQGQPLVREFDPEYGGPVWYVP